MKVERGEIWLANLDSTKISDTFEMPTRSDRDLAHVRAIALNEKIKL
jgi:hypothetical protein